MADTPISLLPSADLLTGLELAVIVQGGETVNCTLQEIADLAAPGGGGGTPVSTTATQSNVGDSASSVQLLAANGNRIGASIFNDSAADLYILCDAIAAASVTTFTFKCVEGAYWVPPVQYTGRIMGIWSSDAGGFARITEYT